MLSDEKLLGIWNGDEKDRGATRDVLPILRAVAEAATQAERHRIYAALDADPGALWRDQGFQEWRSKRNIQAESNLIGANG